MSIPISDLDFDQIKISECTTNKTCTPIEDKRINHKRIKRDEKSYSYKKYRDTYAIYFDTQSELMEEIKKSTLDIKDKINLLKLLFSYRLEGKENYFDINNLDLERLNTSLDQLEATTFANKRESALHKIFVAPKIRLLRELTDSVSNELRLVGGLNLTEKPLAVQYIGQIHHAPSATPTELEIKNSQKSQIMVFMAGNLTSQLSWIKI